MSTADHNTDDRFRTCTKSANVTPWRGDRRAKALREIEALIEEAATGASSVDRDGEEWF